MELIDRLIPAGDEGIRVMVLVSISIFIIFLIVFFSSIKFFYGVWKEDKLIVNKLYSRVDEHDLKHIEINNNIHAMLKEMKANRESDNKQAEITRKLVIFLAKKAKVEIPEI